MPGTPDNQHPNALAAQPVDEVAAKVVHYIRLLRPQVVVTHDPIGGYKHPDHIAMHRATVRAFELASDPNYSSDLATLQASEAVLPDHAQGLDALGGEAGPTAPYGPAPLRSQPGYRPGQPGGRRETSPPMPASIAAA